MTPSFFGRADDHDHSPDTSQVFVMISRRVDGDGTFNQVSESFMASLLIRCQLVEHSTG